MSEPSSTRNDVSSIYVCVRCTNRIHTYAKAPSACTVCGGEEWRTSSDSGRPTAAR